MTGLLTCISLWKNLTTTFGTSTIHPCHLFRDDRPHSYKKQQLVTYNITMTLNVITNTISFILFYFFVFFPTQQESSKAKQSLAWKTQQKFQILLRGMKLWAVKDLKTIFFLAYVHVLAFALRCHAGEVNFELTSSLPCTYHTLFPCVNTIWDVNCVKTTCRLLWSYSEAYHLEASKFSLYVQNNAGVSHLTNQNHGNFFAQIWNSQI